MRTIYLILIGLVFSFTVYSQTPATDKNWEVNFIDEFDFLNTDRWSVANEDDHGGEPQVYLNNSDNVYISNSNLVLKVQETFYSCNDVHDWSCKVQNHYYTSGEIASKSSDFKFGYYEIVCKLPKGKGFWPAFWLWGGCGTCCYNEIDVFEMNGANPTKIGTNLHWDYECSDDLHNVGQDYECSDYSLDYHRYSVEWFPNRITWYIDGKIIRSMDNSYNIIHPQRIVANLALFKKSVDDSTPFPSCMYIDKISAYKLKMDCNTVVNEISDFNTFNYAVKKSFTLSNLTTIPQNSKITLRATDSFELKAGFSVPLGTEFNMTPTPCY